MIKNINEIKRDFIRLRSNEKELYLEVCQIRWPSPHTPASDWVCVKRFGEEQGDEGDCYPLFITEYSVDGTEGKITPWAEVEKAVNKLLNNRRYFRVCGRCRTLNPIGWMHDDFACSRCAGEKLDIVY